MSGGVRNPVIISDHDLLDAITELTWWMESRDLNTAEGRRRRKQIEGLLKRLHRRRQFAPHLLRKPSARALAEKVFGGQA